MEEQQYNYKDKEWLKNKLIEHKTVLNLVRKENIPKTCVYRYIRKFGLQSYVQHQPQNKIILNHDFFENIDNERKAYWLGMLVADGNISDFGRKSYTIRLLLKNSDIYHVEQFAKDIGIDKKVHINKDGRGSIAIHSKKMFFDLMSHGVMPQKTRHEVFPELPKELVPHFIRGFFDGDGTIYKRNETNPKRKRSQCCIGFVCGNKKFIDALNAVLRDECGVVMHPFYRPDKDVWEMKTEARMDCKHIIEYMYKDATVYLKRKKERADEFLQVLPELEKKSPSRKKS